MACIDFPWILLMFLQHNWNTHSNIIGISSDLTICHLTVMCFCSGGTKARGEGALPGRAFAKEPDGL